MNTSKINLLVIQNFSILVINPYMFDFHYFLFFLSWKPFRLTLIKGKCQQICIKNIYPLKEKNKTFIETFIYIPPISVYALGEDLIFWYRNSSFKLLLSIKQNRVRTKSEIDEYSWCVTQPFVLNNNWSKIYLA